MPPEDRFIVRSSPWKLFKLFASAAVFVLMGITFVTHPGAFDVARSGFVTFIGWVSIAFFGLGMSVFTIQLIQRKPEFIIDRSGFTYPKWSNDVVAWRDIADVSVTGISGTKFVTLQFVDPDRLQIGGVKSMMTDLNRQLTGGELNIPLSSADKSLDEVMAAVDRFRPVGMARA
jgi:hypothetical protein